MTFTNVSEQLPNGFHDAELRQLNIDYVSRTLEMSVLAWIGDLSSEIEAEREAYKAATLSVRGLLWCVIEPPSKLHLSTGEGLWIDAGPWETLTHPPAVPTIPPGAFAFWVFSRDWNSFFYICGTEAILRQS